jgi:hypothetical protein
VTLSQDKIKAPASEGQRWGMGKDELSSLPYHYPARLGESSYIPIAAFYMIGGERRLRQLDRIDRA